MSESGEIPRIPGDALTHSQGPDDSTSAEKEEAALNSGLSADELEAAAAADATGAPRIPPLSVDEQIAAASTNTGQAKAEEASLSSYLSAEQLQQRARQMEDDRHQHFKDEFEKIAIAALYISAVTLGVLATIWALHLVLPAEMRWLTSEELTHIQTLLTAGVLVGVVGGHFKKRLSENSSDS